MSEKRILRVQMNLLVNPEFLSRRGREPDDFGVMRNGRRRTNIDAR